MILVFFCKDTAKPNTVLYISTSKSLKDANDSGFFFAKRASHFRNARVAASGAAKRSVVFTNMPGVIR